MSSNSMNSVRKIFTRILKTIFFFTFTLKLLVLFCNFLFVTYRLWAQISSIFWSRKLFSSTKKPKKLNRNQKKLKKFETRRWTPIIKVQNSPNNFQNFPKRCNFQTNRIFFHKYSTFTMVFKVFYEKFLIARKIKRIVWRFLNEISLYHLFFAQKL